jgi:uncharacterized protein (DUF58 family)
MDRSHPKPGFFQALRQVRTAIHGILPRLTRTYALTWEGILVIVLMAVVGLAAWNSGTNLLYLVLATMIGTFLSHGLFALHFMNGLQMRRHLPPEAQAGEAVPVTVTLTNTKKHLPAVAVNVRNHMDDGTLAGVGFCPVLRGRASEEITTEIVFPHRGWFELGRYEIYSRFPFGFAERGYAVRDSDRILVLPPVYPAADLIYSIGLQQGDVASERRGIGVEPHSLREYAPGEHVRNIHWKTSARLGRPMVLEYVLEETRQVILEIDTPAVDNPDLWASYEKAILLAASLSAELLRSGYEVGLRVHGKFVPPGHGEDYHRELGRILAALPSTVNDLSPPSGPQEKPEDPADSGTISISLIYGRNLAQASPTQGSSSSISVFVEDWTLSAGTWRENGRSSDRRGSRQATPTAEVA